MKNMQSDWTVLRDAYPDHPEMVPAVSRVLMDQVAAGERGATIRLSHCGRMVSFGRRDCIAAGYADAVDAARENGFKAIEGIAGGRAAAYVEGTLGLALTVPDEAPARRTTKRFEYSAGVARDALSALGIDARIGEVTGEYCPGAFSVNRAGTRKLVGIGQRMVKGAAHVGFVIAVRDAATVREALEPVYWALGLKWNPDSVGAVDQDIPQVTLADVEDALLARFRQDADLTTQQLDADTVAAAAEMAGKFRSPDPSRTDGPDRG